MIQPATIRQSAQQRIDAAKKQQSDSNVREELELLQETLRLWRTEADRAREQTRTIATEAAKASQEARTATEALRTAQAGQRRAWLWTVLAMTFLVVTASTLTALGTWLLPRPPTSNEQVGARVLAMEADPETRADIRAFLRSRLISPQQ